MDADSGTEETVEDTDAESVPETEPDADTHVPVPVPPEDIEASGK